MTQDPIDAFGLLVRRMLADPNHDGDAFLAYCHTGQPCGYVAKYIGRPKRYVRVDKDEDPPRYTWKVAGRKVSDTKLRLDITYLRRKGQLYCVIERTPDGTVTKEYAM